MKKLLLTLSLTLIASTVHAADAIVEDVIVDVAPGFSWTGAYVGVSAGYLWGESRVDYRPAFDFRSDVDPEGWLGGVYAGYNYQLPNNLVLGAEADFNFSGADNNAPIVNATTGIEVPGQFFDGEINWTGSVRARLGYAVDRFMPFVTGGVAFADYDLSLTALGVTETGLGDTEVGWTVGGGVDYAFTDNLIFRAEYRYADFGDRFVDPAGVLFEDFEVDLATNEVRFGIAYKF